jgi:hypothetical protein
MLGGQILESDPFGNRLQVSIEAQCEEKSGMAIAEVLAGLVVQNPGRIDTLGMRRYGQATRHALVEERPVDLFFGK